MISALLLVVCFGAVITHNLYSAYGTEAISSWLSLAEYTFNAPNSPEDQEYLGLKDLRTFTVSQIPAKLILIACFSFKCPVCNKQVLMASNLFQLIQKNPNLSEDIKMLGICASNSEEKALALKRKYQIPFPLFCDPTFQIHQQFGSLRVPFTVLANNNGEVLLMHYGIMKDIEDFLQLIEKLKLAAESCNPVAEGDEECPDLVK